MRSIVIAWAAAALLVGQSGYHAEIRKWRDKREQSLKAEDGWLSLTGLFWLKAGENRVGSAAGNRVQLPDGFPAIAGTMRLHDGQVTFTPERNQLAQVNGKAIRSAVVLQDDKAGSPDTLSIGRLKLTVIERGSQIGVRMKDSQSEARLRFKGLSWFPVKPEWRVRARFVRQPKRMLFDAQAGGKQEMASPGYVEWTFAGKQLRLTPVSEGDQLFYVFRDTTAGKSTYAAARFLYSDLPKDGFVTLDFNKAYNPPCVFTPYSTCPLPPAENRLPVAVEAGEKMYAAH
jgi:uncharacterized protein (DUF1684 family)